MIKERLLGVFKKYSKISLRSVRLIFSLFIILFLVIFFILGKYDVFEEFSRASDSKKTSEIDNDAQKKIISFKKDSSGKKETTRKMIYGEVEGIQISPSSIPNPTHAQTVNPVSSSNSIPSESSGLLSAVNIFRNSNGLGSLNSSGELCLIAEKRLAEIIEKGGLDSHAGFNKYFQSQSEFNAMGEIIFQSSNQVSPEYAVNEGWARSTSGYRENMLDPKWNYGCGAINGYFAVFNFGKK